MKNRSSKIIVTQEGRVLKALRLEAKLSMKKAAALMGVSDSTVAHVETGRMNAPTGKRLEQFLKVYGGIQTKSFYERARNFAAVTTPQQELLELIMRANPEQTRTLLSIVRGLLS